MKQQGLNKCWIEGRGAINGWCSIPSTITAEIMSLNKFDSIGIDLVAMSVNDILVQKWNQIDKSLLCYSPIRFWTQIHAFSLSETTESYRRSRWIEMEKTGRLLSFLTAPAFWVLEGVGRRTGYLGVPTRRDLSICQDWTHGW